MDNKIQELINVATKFADSTVPNLKGNEVFWNQVKDQKFAELIIRDVVETATRTQNVSPDFAWVILNNYNLEIEK
jgi:hypothetical protein